ncbi:MAG: 4-(cytidine 5'-diphospho)-2-C-methyl-D-erythritol kinase [Deltaproteobacteria bacterium]|nr:4-(cytidine 5'-diphospho)-2-C-methyl-D-erythritol kinase [Deltaproteobacteria bacterium]
MLSVRLRAPAKVNLYLEVCGKRPDGYHDLRMLLAPVSLFDELSVESLEEPGRIELLAGDGAPAGAPEENLCHRAAKYYLKRAGVQAGARIRLEKRIPAGAGLGGGSSDAAVTILGLERLFGRELSAEDRAAAAFEVGADVPFFFARSAAWVEGIGERVVPFPALPALWLLLVYPGAFLSTGAVFSALTMELTTPKPAPTMQLFDFGGVSAGLRNDLQPAAVQLEPAVGEALSALGRVGAAGTLMSGSGSSAFGLFPDEESARAAHDAVSMDWSARGWLVEVVRTLPPGSFPFLS